MINKTTGTVKLKTSSIGYNTDIETLLLALHQAAEFVDPGTESDKGLRWVSAYNIKLERYYYNLFFSLKHGKVHFINIAVYRKKYDPRTIEDPIDEEQEKAKCNFYNKWLTDEIGTSRYFKWGEVNAEMDDGFAHLILKYKKAVEIEEEEKFLETINKTRAPKAKIIKFPPRNS